MPKPTFQLKINKNTRQHHFPAKLKSSEVRLHIKLEGF